MSAELLRKAATILRERAKAATPGPWSPTTGIRPAILGPREPEDLGGGLGSILKTNLPLINGHARREANAAYTATMHPGVGLALADWLDEVAYGVSPTRTDYPHAITVAHLIVGEPND